MYTTCTHAHAHAHGDRYDYDAVFFRPNVPFTNEEGESDLESHASEVGDNHAYSDHGQGEGVLYAHLRLEEVKDVGPKHPEWKESMMRGGYEEVRGRGRGRLLVPPSAPLCSAPPYL